MNKNKHVCEYGCGQEANFFLKKAKKWCCSKSYNSCPIAKQKNREQHLGSLNTRYGKKCADETKKKISQANKGKIPWNKGKVDIYSEEVLKTMSNARTGVIPWNKGKYGYFNHTEESKEKIRISSIGRKHTLDTKQRISLVHKGKIVSEKTRKLMSQNRVDIYGSNNPNWKGGISCEPYCEQWSDKEYKDSIKERDGHMCLNPECSKTTNKICIHHIDYNKKNCHPLNLITICTSCNSKANKDRKWHKSWYQVIISKRYG